MKKLRFRFVKGKEKSYRSPSETSTPMAAAWEDEQQWKGGDRRILDPEIHSKI